MHALLHGEPQLVQYIVPYTMTPSNAPINKDPTEYMYPRSFSGTIFSCTCTCMTKARLVSLVTASSSHLCYVSEVEIWGRIQAQGLIGLSLFLQGIYVNKGLLPPSHVPRRQAGNEAHGILDE